MEQGLKRTVNSKDGQYAFSFTRTGHPAARTLQHASFCFGVTSSNWSMYGDHLPILTSFALPYEDVCDDPSFVDKLAYQHHGRSGQATVLVLALKEEIM
jgi:hypothetical protein